MLEMTDSGITFFLQVMHKNWHMTARKYLQKISIALEQNGKKDSLIHVTSIG